MVERAVTPRPRDFRGVWVGLAGVEQAVVLRGIGVRTLGRLPAGRTPGIVWPPASELPESDVVNLKLLIDSIVQQTTVLIGQIATAAGVRAPLARVADQVFLELARELDAQGVAHRVAADMFGLALRSYQKKVRRLTESASVRDRTLWQAVLDHVSENERVRRRDLLARFRADGEREVGAVLNDLIGSGLLYQTGSGADSLYGVTSENDLRYLMGREATAHTVSVIWTAVHNEEGLSTGSLADRLQLDVAVVREAVDALVADGKLQRSEEGDAGVLCATALFVPVGAEMGWEVAVFDHFRAVANAIAAKIRLGHGRSADRDEVGGATLSFDVYDGHPHQARVAGLLRDVRVRVNELWNDVEAENAKSSGAHPPFRRVYFYFGQYVQGSEEESDGRGDEK
jgi:hypothetical protein